MLQLARADAGKRIVGIHPIKIKVGAQLRRGPEDDAEEGPVLMDRDEVAARIGDDATAIAVTQRQAGKRIDIPIDEESIGLCLLIEGLIVGRRGRRGGAGWLKHRGSGVVCLGKDVGRWLTEIPKVEDVVERDLGCQLPGGAVVGVHINAARVGRAGDILYAILHPGVEAVEGSH